MENRTGRGGMAVFRVLTVIGWMILLVFLLYIWADIRELAAAVKDNKRELLRSSLGGRPAAGNFNFREEASEAVSGEASAAAPAPKVPLNETEEQVLKEVLTEFLG
jgi:hypothetical protein